MRFSLAPRFTSLAPRFASLALLALLAFSPVLVGCDSVRDTLGFQHQTPDEFAVATAPPLAIPPDYTLRPPQPGAAPSQSMPAQAQAQATLIGDSSSGANGNRAAAPGSTSGGEAALLQQAGSVTPASTATTAAATDAPLSNPEQTRIETALFGAPAGGDSAPAISMSNSSLFSRLF